MARVVARGIAEFGRPDIAASARSARCATTGASPCLRAPTHHPRPIDFSSVSALGSHDSCFAPGVMIEIHICLVAPRRRVDRVACVACWASSSWARAVPSLVSAGLLCLFVRFGVRDILQTTRGQLTCVYTFTAQRDRADSRPLGTSAMPPRTAPRGVPALVWVGMDQSQHPQADARTGCTHRSATVCRCARSHFTSQQMLRCALVCARPLGGEGAGGAQTLLLACVEHSAAHFATTNNLGPLRGGWNYRPAGECSHVASVRWQHCANTGSAPIVLSMYVMRRTTFREGSLVSFRKSWRGCRTAMQ